MHMTSLSDHLGSLLAAGSAASFGQIVVALAVAYLGGILASLTPCVYPLIPITVSVVGGIGHLDPHRKHNLRGVWLRGAAYVGGMTVIYSFLGVLAGVSGKVFGSFTNTPGWYLTLGLIMTLASLTMLDIIPFDPAVWWESAKRRWWGANYRPRAMQAQAETSLLGAFTLGASSGFIAAPCTTPVLTSILAYIAQTQSVGLGFGLMFFFSLGLGTILLIVAAFAGAVTVMPRSGQWMKTIKTLSGLLLLAFAQYLMYRAGALGGI